MNTKSVVWLACSVAGGFVTYSVINHLNRDSDRISCVCSDTPELIGNCIGGMAAGFASITILDTFINASIDALAKA
jgi:hypothetical protein